MLLSQRCWFWGYSLRCCMDSHYILHDYILFLQEDEAGSLLFLLSILPQTPTCTTSLKTPTNLIQHSSCAVSTRLADNTPAICAGVAFTARAQEHTHFVGKDRCLWAQMQVFFQEKVAFIPACFSYIIDDSHCSCKWSKMPQRDSINEQKVSHRVD